MSIGTPTLFCSYKTKTFGIVSFYSCRNDHTIVMVATSYAGFEEAIAERVKRLPYIYAAKFKPCKILESKVRALEIMHRSAVGIDDQKLSALENAIVGMMYTDILSDSPAEFEQYKIEADIKSTREALLEAVQVYISEDSDEFDKDDLHDLINEYAKLNEKWDNLQFEE